MPRLRSRFGGSTKRAWSDGRDGPRWYAPPEEDGIALRKAPRPASWNKATDPDQVRLREYLDDTVALLPAAPTTAPWTLMLDIGLPAGRDLLDRADLDNYAYPLASRLRNEHLVSVWCSKRIADASNVLVAPAKPTPAPLSTFIVRTTASSQTRAYKEQVRAAVAHAREVPAGSVHLQLAFVVGPMRNWLILWKPTIDALDPILGRTRADVEWHPRDGRITQLGLHVAIDSSLGHDVVVAIAVDPAVTG